MNYLFGTLSALNFLSAFAFSIKFFFVAPDHAGMYYGTVAWICGFGFAMLNRFSKS